MIKDRLAAGAAGHAVKARYRVEPLADPEAIRPIVSREPAYAAYALAHLEPRLFPRSYWWRAIPLAAEGSAPAPDGGEALVMHARTGLGPSLVALGAPRALEAILRLHPGPFYTFATFQMDHAASPAATLACRAAAHPSECPSPRRPPARRMAPLDA
jgi:hypothetical protein